jgi:hypothetical protein
MEDNKDLYGMKNRSEVLLQALHFENMVTKALTVLLEIDERKNVSFGNSSRALSFDAKVTLLMDLKYLEPEDKLLMTHFMSVRNKFMHRLDAFSYEQCVDQIQDLEKFIRKRYNKWNDICTREWNLQNGVWNIGNDCTQVTTKLFHKILDSINGRVTKISNANKVEIYEEIISDLREKAKTNTNTAEWLNEYDRLFKEKVEKRQLSEHE